MDIRQLRYFIATIEEGSLHGAAQRMNIAQPALSRRIRDLEANLASELLVRGPRGVTPTLAGTTLYREAVQLLAGFDRAARRTQQAGLDQGRIIRLGLVPTSRKYAFTQKAVSAHLLGRARERLAFTRDASFDLAEGLREGRLDLSLLYERHLGSPAFGERVIHRERYVLAVHPAHRLAAAAPIEMEALFGEPLVWLSRRETEGSQDRLMQQCRLHGLEPMIAQMAHSHEEQIDIVAASAGICLTPASTILSTPSDMLQFRPLLRFAMELHLSLAWNAGFDISFAGDLLSHFHHAIDEHQLSIASGDASWATLYGEAVVNVDPT